MNELRDSADYLPGMEMEYVPNCHKILGLVFWHLTCTQETGRGSQRRIPGRPFPGGFMPAMLSDDWRPLAEAVRDEPDPAKLRQLVEQLNRKLKERAENLYQEPGKNSQ
jgi:hypothetical protein